MKKTFLFLGFWLFLGFAHAQTTNPCDIAKQTLKETSELVQTASEQAEQQPHKLGTASGLTSDSEVNSYIHYSVIYRSLYEMAVGLSQPTYSQNQDWINTFFPWQERGIWRSNFDISTYSKANREKFVYVFADIFNRLSSNTEEYWKKAEMFWSWLSDAQKKAEQLEVEVTKLYGQPRRHLILQPMLDEKAALASAKKFQQELFLLGQQVTQKIIDLKSCQ